METKTPNKTSKAPSLILVKHKNQKLIANAVGCKRPYVSLALKGKRHANKALEIRALALSEFDGVEIPLTDEQRGKLEQPTTQTQQTEGSELN